MTKSTSIIIAVIILTGTFYVTRPNNPKLPATLQMYFPGGVNPNLENNTAVATSTNSEIKDSIQYITITVRGGYSPRSSVAKAGIPTKLIMKTSGTYDCSASLVIRSLGYRNILPNTGEVIIDAGTPKAGDVIQGTCGMGMYNFLVTFS
jgi:hypothetical protein